MPLLLMAGIIILALGLISFFCWIGYLWLIIKAFAPLFLLAAGVVVTYLGWEEWRERRHPALDFSSPDEADRYQAEAKAYQEKLDRLRGRDENG